MRISDWSSDVCSSDLFGARVSDGRKSFMFNVYRKEIDWGGRKLTLETGKVARQADGAVVVTYGETVVLCTAVGAKQAKPGIDFFPLTLNYQEKAVAAGTIPGGFFKRQGHHSVNENPVSPLFTQ